MLPRDLGNLWMERNRLVGYESESSKRKVWSLKIEGGLVIRESWFFYSDPDRSSIAATDLPPCRYYISQIHNPPSSTFAPSLDTGHQAHVGSSLSAGKQYFRFPSILELGRCHRRERFGRRGLG